MELAQEQSTEFNAVTTNADDLAFLAYTSGTMRQSKALCIHMVGVLPIYEQLQVNG